MSGSVGDQIVFPNGYNDVHLQGLSYRQYLIGQALAGINARCILNTTEAAITAISLADITISMLDQEKSDHG